jgi:hypothetical protein
MAGIRKISLSSRGEVVAQLLERHQRGLVKDCKRLRLDRHEAGYFPRCEIDWASQEKDSTVDAVAPSLWGEGQQVNWPRCPQDCPQYEKADNFTVSAGRDQFEKRPASRAAPDIEPPVAVAAPPLNEALESHKITLAWVYERVPVSWWWALVGTLAALVSGAFLLGKEYEAIVHKQEAAAPPSTSVPAVGTK